MTRIPAILWLAACLAAPLCASAQDAPASYPLALDPTCRAGQAKLYDECGDQLALFDTAFEAATHDGKVLLVSYGAEWCVWCHVFDRTVAKAGAPLATFAAERFIIVHIEAKYAPGGANVLRKTAADTVYSGGLPFIFVVAKDGTFGGGLQHTAVAAGSMYDESALKRELDKLYTAAMLPDDPMRMIVRQLPPPAGFSPHQ